MLKVFLLLLSGCLIGERSLAQYGTLDKDFGQGGILTTSFDPGDCAAYSVAIQPDKKIVAVGAGGSGFALARYNLDGSLDNNFGVGGKVSTAFGFAQSVGIQSDGKIVVVGYTLINGTQDVFALIRYNSNGSTDSSFGVAGKVTTSFSSGHGYAYSVAIQPDGKIIAGGTNGGAYVTLVRYKTNGSLDSDFATNGEVNTKVGLSCLAYSIAVQTDGKIIAAGSTFNGTGNDFALVRYDSNGTLDNSFGVGGVVISNPGANVAVAQSTVIQPDGKIIEAGWSTYGFALMRYNSNGNADSSFGYNGKVNTIIDSIYDAAYSVALQFDGKIVAVGNSGSNFALVRYNSGGTLDSSFGVDGKVKTSIGSGYAIGRSVVIQPDGKIVVAGQTNTSFALARYISGLVLGIISFSPLHATLLIYPNPIQQYERIEYTLTGDETLSLKLYDASGKLIHCFFENEKKIKGKHQDGLGFGNIPSGYYLLTLSDLTQSISIKLEKQ